jgi:multidrug efflux pump subunit AcrA (membrane-fusion protein)
VVKAGQVLVTLDSGVERAATDAARYRSTMQGRIRTGESRVEFSTAKYHRREKLAGQSFISLHDRDEALTEKKLAESELARSAGRPPAGRNRAPAAVRAASPAHDQESGRRRRRRSPATMPANSPTTATCANRSSAWPTSATLYVEVLMPIEAFGKLVPSGRPPTSSRRRRSAAATRRRSRSSTVCTTRPAALSACG